MIRGSASSAGSKVADLSATGDTLVTTATKDAVTDLFGTSSGSSSSLDFANTSTCRSTCTGLDLDKPEATNNKTESSSYGRLQYAFDTSKQIGISLTCEVVTNVARGTQAHREGVPEKSHIVSINDSPLPLDLSGPSWMSALFAHPTLFLEVDQPPVDDSQLHENDVLFPQQRALYQSSQPSLPDNEIFAGLIRVLAAQDAPNKDFKFIISQIRNLDPPGRFLAQRPANAKINTSAKTWFEIGNRAAIERARCALSQEVRQQAVGLICQGDISASDYMDGLYKKQQSEPQSPSGPGSRCKLHQFLKRKRKRYKQDTNSASFGDDIHIDDDGADTELKEIPKAKVSRKHPNPNEIKPTKVKGASTSTSSRVVVFRSTSAPRDNISVSTTGSSNDGSDFQQSISSSESGENHENYGSESTFTSKASPVRVRPLRTSSAVSLEPSRAGESNYARHLTYFGTITEKTRHMDGYDRTLEQSNSFLPANNNNNCTNGRKVDGSKSDRKATSVQHPTSANDNSEKGKLSKKDMNAEKQVGSRVYARWANNEYFWGRITEKTLSAKNKWVYSVKFDDGDQMSGLPCRHLCTVLSYQIAFEKEPPPLPKCVTSVLEVGCRVYCKWIDDSWFWGHIRSRNERGKLQRYSVDFDDGDTIDGLSANDICTLADYKVSVILKFEESQYMSVEAFVRDWNSEKTSEDPTTLVCEEFRNWWYGERREKLRKSFPLSIQQNPNSEKPHSAQSDVSAREDEVGCRVYCRYKSDLWFWGHIKSMSKKNKFHQYSVEFDDGGVRKGVAPDNVLTITEYKIYVLKKFQDSPYSSIVAFVRNWNDGKNRDNSDLLSYHKVLLWLKNCKKEENCDNDDFMRCSTKSAVIRINCAKKRPCRTRSIEEKKQIIEKFKTGSYFNVVAFLDDYNKGKNTEDDEYLSQESLKFLLPAGKCLDGDVSKSYRGQDPKRVRVGHDKILNLKSLYKSRCHKCLLCQKVECTKCASCIRNKAAPDQHSREVCLRKMCCNIKLENKAQIADGFPAGWRFVFDKPKKSVVSYTTENCVAFEGLLLLAPNGRDYASIERAFNHNKAVLRDTEGISQAFYALLGESFYQKEQHHILIGRGISEQWTDVYGRNKVVDGVITGCKPKTKGEETDYYYVKYNKDSKSLTNSIKNCCSSAVAEGRKMKSPLAWGGCLMFEEKRNTCLGQDSSLRSLAGHISCLTWITPEMRHEELLDIDGETRLPRLTLAIRGYQLVFSIRESTIPMAGYGVFVKATQWVGAQENSKTFDLKTNELLDLGVYAPFRIEDKKKECVFFVKNFIHSMNCEEWSFDTDNTDTMFDITDDLTGDPHDLARCHIPSYVNECGRGKIPTVHAEHDPEGNVHYLLGITEESQDMLSLPVNGEEVEIFVHYGPLYESIRLRKGYSELPAKEKERRLAKLEDEDLQYLSDINNFCEENIADCVEFFQSLFSISVATQNVSNEVRRRSLQVLCLLGEKVEAVLVSEDSNGEGLDNTKDVIASLISRINCDLQSALLCTEKQTGKDVAML